MSGSLTVVPSTLVIHECRGLKKGAHEEGERWIRIERLPEDDPSQMRFQVTVVHPHTVHHKSGDVGRSSSRQEPEIVHRGNDERTAKLAYSVYAKVLGGTPPAEFDPPPGPADPKARYVTREQLETLEEQFVKRFDALASKLDEAISKLKK